MTKWIHSRKGPLEGDVVRTSGEFVTIRLAGDHALTYLGTEGRQLSREGAIDRDGDLLTARACLLREVPEDAEA